jgi:hypothetical protein
MPGGGMTTSSGSNADMFFEDQIPFNFIGGVLFARARADALFREYYGAVKFPSFPKRPLEVNVTPGAFPGY